MKPPSNFRAFLSPSLSLRGQFRALAFRDDYHHTAMFHSSHSFSFLLTLKIGTSVTLTTSFPLSALPVEASSNPTARRRNQISVESAFPLPLLAPELLPPSFHCPGAPSRVSIDDGLGLYLCFFLGPGCIQRRCRAREEAKRKSFHLSFGIAFSLVHESRGVFLPTTAPA